MIMILGSAIGTEQFPLYDAGTEDIVDYGKYGQFEGVGTDKYKYTIVDHNGLKAAVGEGVFPNTTSLLRDPQYKKFEKEGKLNGNQWDFVNTDDYQSNFYKWASSSDEPGAKQYYTAMALEKAGHLRQAIKAYYAIVVNFPESTGYTYWKTPWQIGPVAIDRIKYLTREHPELGLQLVDAEIRVKGKFRPDANTKDKPVFIVNPGRLVAAPQGDADGIARVDLQGMAVSRTIGKGQVQLLQYQNGHWQLMVDNKPYVIRGIAYSPSKVGLSPDNGTLNVSRDWMFSDVNGNGIVDGPYESWVDQNGNNRQDTGEDAVGDFKLMKELGVNTLRIYHYADLNKDVLMDGYKNYGFRYLMGNLIGMYAIDSKADWYGGTDYTNPEHRRNMLESVRRMVNEYKDEPYILMWVLGNENNYAEPGQEGKDKGQGCRAKIQPEAYYRFVNEAAQLIKSLDPQQRPVAVSNGDVLFLDICAQCAPAVDVFGANAYRGEQGFGSLWKDVADVYGRPVMVTEYGCSAYGQNMDARVADEGQARYIRGNWRDIEDNIAGAGTGNALGGILFEWSDEWWKAGRPPEFDPSVQDKVGQFGAPFLDGWSYEEWLGITSQGDGSQSPFLRQLRPAYYELKKHWSK
jgi:beta-glucuronidase